MRAVIDTNVAVSALINPLGTPGRIVGEWKRAVYDWVITPDTFAEMEGVLNRGRITRYLPKGSTRAERFLRRLSETAVTVRPAESLSVFPLDPADDRFIEAAVASNADFIVTGDLHLLELREYEGTRIVSPIEFLAALRLMP